ncbi:hypothetical protein PWT90_04211 [Aphanocladium album]|nr:hypothetical protein PWT90_04211 [Aphanocladium album]
MQNTTGIADLPKKHLGEGNALSLVALGSVLLVLGTQASALRFWARKRSGARLLLDDWMVLPAWVRLFSPHDSFKHHIDKLLQIAFVTSTSLILYCVKLHSLGYPRMDYIPGVPSNFIKAAAVSSLSFNILSIVVFGCAKVSALLFYRRVFCASGGQPLLAKVILVALPVLGVWTVFFVFMTIFQCGTHFDAPWNGTKLKYCNWSYPSIEGTAVSNVLLDVFVVLLPIYPITKLATSTKNKAAILSVFLIALVGVAASITRLVIVEKIVAAGRKVVNNDMEYYMSKAAFYWILEMGTSVVVVNLPPIWTALDAKASLLSGFGTLGDDEGN